MSRNHHTIAPFLAALIGIALFSAMDAAMKAASLAIGAYSAFFWRNLVGCAMAIPLWWWRAGQWPSRKAMRLHLLRSLVIAFMGWSFFFALTRLPIAETIALSFIAPLIALFLASLLLKEQIEMRAVLAALLGILGVATIVGARLTDPLAAHDRSLEGMVAIFLSALLYAWNLILQRQQALVARPTEIATFQPALVALVLLGFAPFLLKQPSGTAQWGAIFAGAGFALAAILMLSWAYARAESKALVPFEYSGFLWAALFGWLVFDERLSLASLAGALLIIAGCWIAWRQPRTPAAP